MNIYSYIQWWWYAHLSNLNTKDLEQKVVLHIKFWVLEKKILVKRKLYFDKA